METTTFASTTPRQAGPSGEQTIYGVAGASAQQMWRTKALAAIEQAGRAYSSAYANLVPKPSPPTVLPVPVMAPAPPTAPPKLLGAWTIALWIIPGPLMGFLYVFSGPRSISLAETLVRAIIYSAIFTFLSVAAGIATWFVINESRKSSHRNQHRRYQYLAASTAAQCAAHAEQQDPAHYQAKSTGHRSPRSTTTAATDSTG